jgi:ribosomal protein S18 acetylase RimI-like enzyme
LSADHVDIVRIAVHNLALLSTTADDVFDDDLDDGLVERYVNSDTHMLVAAIIDGVVVGQSQGSIQHHVDGDSQLYIDNLGVAPTHQRHGTATQLLNEIIAWGRESGCRQAWIVTEPDNTAANLLYDSMGSERSLGTLHSLMI